MMRPVSLFALLALVAAVVWLAIAPAAGRAGQLRAEITRWVFVGAPLMELQFPAPDLETPLGAVDVLISFVAGPRVAVETFQCLLNDQDVTAALTLGRNGAAGSLIGLHEGENRIVVRVFGKSWWGEDGFVEEQRAVIVRVRPIPFMDVA
jgi:hypothetical protein